MIREIHLNDGTTRMTTDNDRIVMLMRERGELRREADELIRAIKGASSAFGALKVDTERIADGTYGWERTIFHTYPNHEELTTKKDRLIEIYARIEKIEECVPELKQ